MIEMTDLSLKEPEQSLTRLDTPDSGFLEMKKKQIKQRTIPNN